MLLLILLLAFLTLNNYYHEFNLVVIERALTIQNVKEELRNQNIKHSSIVLKQIRLETGNLKYIRYNNLFGFRGNNGYLKFDTWIDAVAYAKKWQLKNYKGGDYYDFLIRIKYAKDSTYINKLKQM